MRHLLLAFGLASIHGGSPLHAQFDGFQNKGLVGVGRLSAALFDKAGTGTNDTIGGFSAMTVDRSTLRHDGERITGTLYGLPDRGFGDGGTDYHPRIEVFDFAITPYYGTGPVPQEQIAFTNTQTILLTYDNGTFFTGFDAGNTNNPTAPQSATNSLGQGRRSLDAEGIVRMPDGSWWISDEYGPAVFRFNAAGQLQETILPPAALQPRQGIYPGRLNFTGNAAPTSGRRNNRGLEGLDLTPDGKRLIAFLQSPNIQDGGAGNLGRNTRILQLDAEPASPTYGRTVAEHVYQLTLNGNSTTNRHTPVSEVLALNATTFLVLERDGIGRGVGDTNTPIYKRVVVASTAGASNIAGTAYDLERGAPGQLSLPAGALPADLKPVARMDLIDMLDPAQLGKFGLSATSNPLTDSNAIGEKWEALSLVPLNDPAAPNDFLLLVGNDNDFKAPLVYHNGEIVGTNEASLDIMLLAYRVTLPGIGLPRANNTAPVLSIAIPRGDVFAAGPLPLTASVADEDGIIVKAEFFEDDVKIGEAGAFPFVLARTNTAGMKMFKVRVTDNDGAVTETMRHVTITAQNQAPAVALTAPVSGTTGAAPYTLRPTVTAEDTDGFIVRVEYFAGTNRLASSTNAPWSATIPNLPVGTRDIAAVATDNLGLATTSAPVAVTVTRAVTAPFTLQVLHASDFEGGIPALDDAPRFSSVLEGLKLDYPTNTVVLSSGDNYIPGPFFTASADPAAGYNGVKGRGDIEILNALGIQAAAFGNHEFDDNTAQVRSMLLADAAVGYRGTLFPYLSANLNFAPDSSLASMVTADGQEWTAGTNKIAKGTIISVGGQRIGVVGATTIELRQISSPGAVGVSTNLVGDIQPAVDALLAQGINKIIVMAHLQQYQNEFDLAPRLRNVDILIAGGNHQVFAKTTDRLRSGDVAAEAYPTTFTSPLDEPIHVVNTGPNYRYVGRLIASFNDQGVISGLDPRSGSYATDLEGVAATGNRAPNTNVVNVVNKLGAIIDSKDARRFGRTTEYLNGARNSVRTEETNLGDLTADANLYYGQQLDPATSISLKNGGGIRDAIGAIASVGSAVVYTPPPANPRVGKQAGEISQLDIENSLRFNNGLSLITLTAQQLRDAMEWAVAGSGTPGQFPQVGGMSFSFNPTNRAMTYLRAPNGTPNGIDFPGERLRTLVVYKPDGTQDLVVENGQLVGAPSRTFRMVTLDFLAGGGDTYFPLTQATERRDLVPAGTIKTFDSAGTEQKALADYLAAIGTFSDPDVPAAQDFRIQNLARRVDAVIAPVIERIETAQGGARIRFGTLPGKAYEVFSKDDVADQWQSIGLTAQGNGSPAALIDGRPYAPYRFYQVVVTR